MYYVNKNYEIVLIFVYFGCLTNQRSSFIDSLEVTLALPPKVGHMTLHLS